MLKRKFIQGIFLQETRFLTVESVKLKNFKLILSCLDTREVSKEDQGFRNSSGVGLSSTLFDSYSPRSEGRE